VDGISTVEIMRRSVSLNFLLLVLIIVAGHKHSKGSTQPVYSLFVVATRSDGRVRCSWRQ
jgi:hypothetical protein